MSKKDKKEVEIVDEVTNEDEETTKEVTSEENVSVKEDENKATEEKVTIDLENITIENSEKEEKEAVKEEATNYSDKINEFTNQKILPWLKNNWLPLLISIILLTIFRLMDNTGSLIADLIISFGLGFGVFYIGVYIYRTYKESPDKAEFVKSFFKNNNQSYGLGYVTFLKLLAFVISVVAGVTSFRVTKVALDLSTGFSSGIKFVLALLASIVIFALILLVIDFFVQLYSNIARIAKTNDEILEELRKKNDSK